MFVLPGQMIPPSASMVGLVIINVIIIIVVVINSIVVIIMIIDKDLQL